MIWETIKARAKTNGDKLALVCHDKQYTYKELVESIEKLIAILSTAMSPGDKVLFASDKEYHYVRMVLACDALGITFMPTFPNLPDKVIEGIKSASKPDHVILSEEDATNLKPHNKGLVYTRSINDLFTVIFTSGTTGEPKAVAHNRLACVTACVQSMEILEMKENDVVLAQLPPSTIAGLYLFPLPGLMKGSTVVMEMFNPRKFIELLKNWKPTIGLIVPAMMIALSKTRGWSEHDMSHWKTLCVGSTVIPEEMLNTLFDMGVPQIRNFYGCTETHVPPFTNLIKPNDEHPLQLHITKNYEYKLDRFNVLWLRGIPLMKGYINYDAPIDSEGYWCTGDVFERKHNLLFYKSRQNDLIKVNSFNVSPVGIENALLVHPNIDEVCVTYRDRDLGEKEIVAVCVSDSEINSIDLLNFIKDKLFQYELPKEIIVTKESLPRNKMGKVQRQLVREKFVETE